MVFKSIFTVFFGRSPLIVSRSLNKGPCGRSFWAFGSSPRKHWFHQSESKLKTKQTCSFSFLIIAFVTFLYFYFVYYLSLFRYTISILFTIFYGFYCLLFICIYFTCFSPIPRVFFSKFKEFCLFPRLFQKIWHLICYFLLMFFIRCFIFTFLLFLFAFTFFLYVCMLSVF